MKTSAPNGMAGFLNRLAILLSAAFLLASPTTGQENIRFPSLTSRVVDQAALLSPGEEAAFEARLAALERDTSHQLVVVTVQDLQGLEIEDYGYRLGRAWGIGQAEADNGVLLIVAPRERRVRIEVGYGLEPILTDALSTLIIHNQILPAFREGAFDRGIEAGVLALEQQLRLDPDEAQARAASVREPRERPVVGPILMILVVFLFIGLSAMAGAGRGRRRRANGLAPILIWGASEALRGRGRGGSSWGGGFGGGFGGGGGGFGGGGASGGW